MSHKFINLLTICGTTEKTTTIGTATPRTTKFNFLSWSVVKVDVSGCCTFVCETLFFFLFSKWINTSTFLCWSCSPEETHWKHRGMSHGSQWSSHCSKECIRHFGLIILSLNGTTLCFFFIYLRYVFPHSFYTNVCRKCCSAKLVPGFHTDDTEPHPESCTLYPW